MSYSLEWTPAAAVLGAVALLWIPGIALIVLFVVALAAAAAVVALAAAVVASPFLLGRYLARRWQSHAEEREEREAHVPRPEFA
jgi:membrane protein implicated in regulation of membrane protease activity